MSSMPVTSILLGTCCDIMAGVRERREKVSFEA